MDRYEAIDRAADLGGIEMFPDHTEDLIQKENRAPVAPGDAAEVRTNHQRRNEL